MVVTVIAITQTLPMNALWESLNKSFHLFQTNTSINIQLKRGGSSSTSIFRVSRSLSSLRDLLLLLLHNPLSIPSHTHLTSHLLFTGAISRPLLLRFNARSRAVKRTSLSSVPFSSVKPLGTTKLGSLPAFNTRYIFFALALVERRGNRIPVRIVDYQTTCKTTLGCSL